MKVRIKQVLEVYVDVESSTKIGAVRQVEAMKIEAFSTEPWAGLGLRRYRKKARFDSVKCTKCDGRNHCWTKHLICWSCRQKSVIE